MKSLIIVIAAGFALYMLPACHEAEKVKPNTENDSLKGVVTELNYTLNELISSFDTVASNLDKIAAKEQVLYFNAENKGVLKPTVKERVNAAIADINALMIKNKSKLDELNDKLKTSHQNNIYLGKIITILSAQLNQKNNELQTLNGKLSTQNEEISKLKTDLFVLSLTNDVYAEAMQEDEAILHTAYYLVGKTKYLEEIKLVDRKGGLLGMGKTTKLSSDFDETKFVKIDYNQQKSIPVNCKKYKIITSHPTDSYQLKYSERDKDKVLSIDITNPEKFWRASKYLVVSID